MLTFNELQPGAITENLIQTAPDSVLNAPLSISGYGDSCKFASLPSLIKKGIEVFHNEKERDLFLYSTIVALSGIMQRAHGVYCQKVCYPNLFFMALAPAASGKGSMGYARQLIEPIHRRYVEESKQELLKYNSIPKKLRGTRPLFKAVFIPANSSSSKLLQHISDNKPFTPTILYESELDTLSVANASDFGNFSDILRKVFQNEPVSQSRRTNDEFIDVQNPKLAMVLSGTPGQLFEFIHNKEDGLLSRFLVMNFDNNVGWRSVGPCPTCINLTEHFESLSKEYLNFYDFISRDDLEIELSDEQWKRLDTYGDEKYQQISDVHCEDATSVIKRHGLMLFKICMVLAGIRKYEEKLNLDKMICSDDDFATALYLIDQSLYSSLEIYEALPKSKTPGLSNIKIGKFYGALKEEFSRADAITTAEGLIIMERTADRYLQVLVSKGHLTQPKSGYYKKKTV